MKGRELENGFRGVTPCHGCTERFIACSDHCPKDERGEYGYKAWKAEFKKVKEKRKEYYNKRRLPWERTISYPDNE